MRLSPFLSSFIPSHMQDEKRYCVLGSGLGTELSPSGATNLLGTNGTVGGRGGGHISVPVPRVRPAEPIPSHVGMYQNVVLKEKGVQTGKSKPAGNSVPSTGQRRCGHRNAISHISSLFLTTCTE